jgi:hypothetical protein
MSITHNFNLERMAVGGHAQSQNEMRIPKNVSGIITMENPQKLWAFTQ